MTKGIDIKAMIAFRHAGNTWQECADKFGITWAARAKVLYDQHTNLADRLPVKRKRGPSRLGINKATQGAPDNESASQAHPGVIKPKRYTSEATDEEVAQAQRVIYCERHIECIDQYRHASKCPFSRVAPHTKA